MTIKNTIENLLKELETQKEKTSGLFWNISWETGKFLHDLVLERKPKIIVEVGTSNGFSGLWLASAAATYGGELWTIESSEKRIPVARETFEKSGLQNIHLIEGHAPEVFWQLPDAVDMAFFDGTKYEYLSYFQSLESKFSSRVVILADNITSHASEVKKYLDYVRMHDKYSSHLIEMGTGVEMTKRG